MHSLVSTMPQPPWTKKKHSMILSYYRADQTGMDWVCPHLGFLCGSLFLALLVKRVDV